MRLKSIIAVVAGLCLACAVYGGADVYRLRSGDTLSIRVFKIPEMTGAYMIALDGRIEIPRVGTIACETHTVEDIRQSLKTLILDRNILTAIPDGDITVHVSAFAPSHVYIWGRIGRPQQLSMEPFKPFTITQAVAVAGDLAEGADGSAIQIHRLDTSTGKTQVHIVDFSSITRDRNTAIDVKLQDGDRIFVPSREQYYLFGEIRNPGAYDLPSVGVLTVSKAIVRAGGWGRFASRTDVLLIRRTPEGGSKKISVNVKRIIQDGLLSQDPEVQPGDVIFVDEAIL